MTQDTKSGHVGPVKDEINQLFLAVHVKVPTELNGSRMERESYLDHVSSEILVESKLPQSRP